MSKYIKLEDAIDGKCPVEDIWEDCINCPLDNKADEPCKMGKWLNSLPTYEVADLSDEAYEVGYTTGQMAERRRKIEVSEDCISRANLIQDLHKDAERVEMEEFANDTVWRTIGNAPSVISQVPSEDAISRKYINDKIGTYFSERGDFGSLECFWILEAIKHAPSVVPKPKEGEEE